MAPPNERYGNFNEPNLVLSEIQQGKFTLVDSRFEDPIEYEENEYNQKKPTLNTVHRVNGFIPVLGPQLHVNYGSYIYNQNTGSDPSHPNPFKQTTF